MLSWKLIYFAPKPMIVAEYDIPEEAMRFGNDFAGCELVWGMTPEGHRFAQFPGLSGQLQLRNPYYDFVTGVKFP